MSTLRIRPRWKLRPHLYHTHNVRHGVRAQRGLQQSTHTTDPTQVPDRSAKAFNPSGRRRLSRVRFALRSILYIGLFGVSGFALAWGWKTWSYLQMGRAMGRPETRVKNKSWFSTHIDQSLLVQSLRKDGWIEEDPMDKERYLDDSTRQETKRGRHLVHEELTDKGYMATKHFRHPTDSMTVLVFMADFACESWPYTLHGGVATTVIQDALDTHVKNFPGYVPIRNRKTTMNYRLPLKPGVMYSILVQTDEVDYPHQTAEGTDKNFMVAGANFTVNEMDRAPRYIDKYNEATKSNERFCDIHNSGKDITTFLKGGSILFLAAKHYRDMIDKDQQLVPALQAKLDAWQKAYRHSKSVATR